MSREVAGHLLIKELQMPSVDTSPLLWVGCAILQLWIIDTPTEVSHDSIFFSRLKIWILRLLRLVIPQSVPNLFKLKTVQCFNELFLNPNI